MNVFGCDIGGTKIKAAAVALPASPAHDPRVLRAAQIPTPRLPPSAFYDQIAALLRSLDDGSTRGLVSVAHPGRFLPDGSLARGTVPNLGEHPNQFDGLNPSRELSARLGMTVVAENDAVSQMRFALHALLRDPAGRARLLGQTVVYVGPGTGMGGGVARIDAHGGVRPITDGHLFDLQLSTHGDGTLTAEELFTGPALARRIAAANAHLDVPITPPTGDELPRLLSDTKTPPAHRQTAEQIVKESGEILGKLITVIHAGRIVKVRLEVRPDGGLVRHVDEPDRTWPAADQAAVRGVTRVVLGGSIGVNPVLGGALRRWALEWLAQQNLGQIDIIQSPVPSADAGVLGAVLALIQGQTLRWGA